MQRKALKVEAMHLYAASFAGELQNQLPKIADPNDRILQESLISYFYRGLHPEYLREKKKSFQSFHHQQGVRIVLEVLYSTYGRAGELCIT